MILMYNPFKVSVSLGLLGLAIYSTSTLAISLGILLLILSFTLAEDSESP